MNFAVRPGFNAEEYLKHAWGIVKGEIVPVKVIFSRSVARYIRDRLWHSSQKFRELADGRLEMNLRVADTLEVRRWVLGYGPDAEVIEPASIRQALREQAEALGRKLVPTRVAPASSVSASRAGVSARRSTIG